MFTLIKYINSGKFFCRKLGVGCIEMVLSEIE